jgi:hypothetical protein
MVCRSCEGSSKDSVAVLWLKRKPEQTPGEVKASCSRPNGDTLALMHQRKRTTGPYSWRPGPCQFGQHPVPLIGTRSSRYRCLLVAAQELSCREVIFEVDCAAPTLALTDFSGE